ncbi:MAG TPA: hypothetical protein VF045_04255 [Acidimicrobiales bacterium]
MGGQQGRKGSSALWAGMLAGAVLAACVADGGAPSGAGSGLPPESPAHARESRGPAPGTGAPAARATADDPAQFAEFPGPGYLTAGTHRRTVNLDGQNRRWTTIVPGTADGVPAAGVVVVLHGVGGRGTDMRATVGLEPLAASAGVVLVFPDAFGGAWNDGRPGADPAVAGTSVDDVRFLRLLIDETVERTGTASDRVALVGFSAGAIMASRFGCDVADRVGAMALIAGSAGQGFQQSCRPARPVATLMVAGSADGTVPYGGGRVSDWGTKKRGFVAAVDDVFAFWSAQGGCAVVAPPAPATAAPVTVTRTADCKARTTVVRYRVNGGGHEWFRAPRFDTTATVWDFVSGRFAAATSPMAPAD